MNGPLRVFEVTPFGEGMSRCSKHSPSKVHSWILVGDSVAALEAFGKVDSVSYVSTGGGATLVLLAGDLFELWIFICNTTRTLYVFIIKMCWV
jgi:phosphoglycerate kinase